MLALPLLFVGVVARFPAGLAVYWITTSLWTLGQQFVLWRLAPAGPAPCRPVGRIRRRAGPHPATQLAQAQEARPPALMASQWGHGTALEAART